MKSWTSRHLSAAVSLYLRLKVRRGVLQQLLDLSGGQHVPLEEHRFLFLTRREDSHAVVNVTPPSTQPALTVPLLAYLERIILHFWLLFLLTTGRSARHVDAVVVAIATAHHTAVTVPVFIPLPLCHRYYLFTGFRE